MIKYKIITDQSVPNLLRNLKEINSDGILILYENETYDGPEEGVCVWNEKKYYFKVLDSFEYFKHRDKKSYFLIKLNDEQLLKDELLHNQLLNSKSYDEYNKLVENLPDQEVNENQIVGWFEL